MATDRGNTKPRRVREKFYMWRKDTVDIVYGWLSQNEDYEKSIENAVFDILALYQGHLVAPWASGTRYDADQLTWRTTEIVAFACELALLMRRSRDGTWSPFVPTRGTPARPHAVMAHRDVTLREPTGHSLPRGRKGMGPAQDGILEASTVTMTVVPGLSKYEMRDVEDDPLQPGVRQTRIFKTVRMKAKCLIDLTEQEVGPLMKGDIWFPDDL